MGLGSQVVLPARSHGGQDRRIRWIGGRSRPNPIGNKKKTNFGCWMTLRSSGSIHSVQNGMPLRSNIHDIFDGFDFSTPYTIYCSTPQWVIVGLGRPQNCLLPTWCIWIFRKIPGPAVSRLSAKPDRPSEHLLRWHYRQSSFDKYERRRGAHTGTWLPSRFWYDFPDP